MTVADLMGKLLDMPGNAEVEIAYFDSKLGWSGEDLVDVVLEGDVVVFEGEGVA